MDNLLNLNNLPEDKRKQILEILGNNDLKSELRKIANNNVYNLKTGNRYTNQYDIPQIEVDNAQVIDNIYSSPKKSDVNSLYERRMAGKLSLQEQETYRQLTIIHGDGFWDRVREVVMKKKDISMDGISNVLTEEDLY